MNKVTKAQYENLKKSYLCKNRSLYSLYVELNHENNVNKHLFFQLINHIRQEEGLDHYYTKKQKKRNNVIVNLDKSPNHYNQKST